MQANSHKVRVFALGIGDAASHDLVEGVAKAGCGTAAFVTYNESLEKKVLNQLKNALQPSLTDITLEWEGLASDPVKEQLTPVLNKKKTLLGYNKPIESDSLTPESSPKIKQSPKRIPPVYDGSQLLVFGLFKNYCESGGNTIYFIKHNACKYKCHYQHSPCNNLDGDTYLIHRLAAIKLIRELESLESALHTEGSEAEKSLKHEIVEIACQNGMKIVRQFCHLSRLSINVFVLAGVTSRYTAFIANEVKDDKQLLENWVMETRYVSTQYAHGWHGGHDILSLACSHQTSRGLHDIHMIQLDMMNEVVAKVLLITA